MTIPQIKIDGYGIIITDADGETVNISAEDALNLANQIYARKPLLEAIINRKKVGTSNEALHNEVQNTTPFTPGTE